MNEIVRRGRHTTFRLATALVVALLVTLVLNAQAQDLDSGRLILGTIQSTTAPETLAANEFANWIEEETDGRFQVTVVPAAQLGPALEQYEHTQTGAQHLFVDALEWNGQFVEDYGVLAVPFGLQSVEHLVAVLESELGDEWRQRMEDEYNLVTLSDQLVRSPRVVHAVERVETPDDMRGMPFRVPEIDVYFESWRAIGVSPTPVAWGEKYFALQQGVIRGGEGPFTTLYPMRFTEVSEYILETNHLYSMNTLVMHKGTFDRLSEEDQRIFTEVAQRTAEYYTELVGDLEDEHREQMASEHGVTFVEPSEEALEQFRTLVGDAVADFEARGMWSEGLYEQVQAIGE